MRRHVAREAKYPANLAGDNCLQQRRGLRQAWSCDPTGTRLVQRLINRLRSVASARDKVQANPVRGRVLEAAAARRGMPRSRRPVERRHAGAVILRARERQLEETRPGGLVASRRRSTPPSFPVSARPRMPARGASIAGLSVSAGRISKGNTHLHIADGSAALSTDGTRTRRAPAIGVGGRKNVISYFGG